MRSLGLRCAALLSGVALPITGLTGHAGTAQLDSAALGPLAESYLQERADRVSGGVARSGQAFGSLRLAPALRQHLDGATRNLDELRHRLVEAGAGYSRAVVDVAVVSSRVESGRAVLVVNESTKLFFSRSSRTGPAFEQYVLPHTLSFTATGAGWRLDTAKAHLNGGLAPATQTTGEWRTMVKNPVPYQLAAAPVDVTAPRAYNKSAMAAYALRHWHTAHYNKSYRKYSNDCTNFISQAVRAGGWTFVNNGGRKSNKSWYYGRYTFTTSYTWAGAHNWYFFARMTRSTGWPGLYRMVRGDVLQLNFGKSGGIDHTMMVTWIDEFDRYLSYHTTDTGNRPLKSILRQYPTSTNWYYPHGT